eukprot:6187041-Pleurochrysis_carterae.AAC.1
MERRIPVARSLKLKWDALERGGAAEGRQWSVCMKLQPRGCFAIGGGVPSGAKTGGDRSKGKGATRERNKKERWKGVRTREVVRSRARARTREGMGGDLAAGEVHRCLVPADQHQTFELHNTQAPNSGRHLTLSSARRLAVGRRAALGNRTYSDGDQAPGLQPRGYPDDAVGDARRLTNLARSREGNADCCAGGTAARALGEPKPPTRNACGRAV